MKRLLPLLALSPLIVAQAALAAEPAPRAAPEAAQAAGARGGVTARLAPPASPGDYGVYIDPATATPANNCYPMIKYVGQKVFCAGWALSKTFDSSWSTYGNANLFASQVTTSGTSPAAAVAIFGQGIAGSSSVKGGGAWGLNTNGYSVGDATAISAELDAGLLVDPAKFPRAHAFGLVVVSTGYFPGDSAIQIQSNHQGDGPHNTRWHNGIKLNGDSISQYGITASNLNARVGIGFAGRMSTSEIDFPDFKVGATPPSGTARVQIEGSATGDPVIAAVPTAGLGPPAGAGSLIVRGLGSGGVRVQDGAHDTVVEAAAPDRLGFYGAAPAARPTVTGSRGGNAALASLLTALAQLGLITDHTTP